MLFRSHQARVNSFSNRGNKQDKANVSPTQQFASEAGNIPFAGINPNQYRRQLNEQEINPQHQGPEFQRGVPLEINQINPKNPVNPEFKTQMPWSQDRREKFVDDYLKMHPFEEPSTAYKEADRAEANELAQPEAVQKESQRLDEVREKLNKSFQNKLGKKLQKRVLQEGEISPDIYKDITGENIAAVERAMDDELATNPRANIEDVADKWSTKLLDLAKTKDQMKTLEKGSWLDFLQPRKHGVLKQKLDSYSKIFADTGNSEEYFNILKADFDMTPQGAASIAYPPSKGMSKYLNAVKFTPAERTNSVSNAKKYASEIGSLLSDDDSILSVARNLYEKDPFFDQYSFFDYLNKNQDRLRLNARQKRELGEGVQTNIIPTWGDFWITGKVR